MAHLDRVRAQRLMQESGIDALILFSPEAFRHATGVAAGVATMWRKAGSVAVLIPADATAPEMAVVSDLFASAFRRESHVTDIRESPIWVEALALPDAKPDVPASAQMADLWHDPGRPPGNARPETFDPRTCFCHLREALAEKGLASGRIGIEYEAVSATELPILINGLENACLVDGTSVARQLRAVKSPGEISALRSAVTIAEAGIAAVREAVRPGVSRSELATVWQATVRDHGANLPMTGAWEYISVGADPWGGDAVAKPGDLVKVDVGCLVDGYSSDTGRTFAVGQPSRLQADLYNALLAGFEAGMPLLRPGATFSEIHLATQSAIRARGFPGYSRGHFGHGLGTGPGSEEWPFISAQSGTRVETGMVLAFECPLYITGVGGLIIEDQIEITPQGPVSMNLLPRELVVR